MEQSRFDVDGSSAIVTGASSGIGRVVAEQFAAKGVDVAICSRDQERVDVVADGINASDRVGQALAIECDVRDREAVESFVDATVDEFGGVDVLVNNAAGTFRCDFEELSENAWKTIIDINLHGTFNCTQAAGTYMREAGQGNIVNFSSIAALSGSPRTSHYAASKAAVINLTESLAIEWAEFGIRVNCVAPGLIATPPVQERLELTDADLPDRDDVNRRLGTEEEIADIVQFLTSRASSFLTGETIVAQGVPPARSEEPT